MYTHARKFMDFLNDILQYSHLSNALYACILSGIACGIVGTYIVARRMVFLSGGITHSSFGGMGIALYANTNPIVGAMIFAIAAALGIEWASERGRIRQDSAIGIVWSVGMAIGIVFMNLRPGYAAGDLSAYLFGSIITVTRGDVVALGVLCLLLIAGAIAWLRQVMFVAFDRDFAASQGIPTRAISYIMAIVVAATIVLSIRVMGIILLISLLTMPAVIVNSITKSYRTITLWAAVVGMVANVIGLTVSYYFEIPPSAVIIFILTLTLIIVKLLPARSKKLATSR